MAGRLGDQHILVTGGARGIGAAIAGKALAEGALVSIIDIDEAAGNEILGAVGAGKRACFNAGDVRRGSNIARALEAATKLFGPVMGLVNNAGRNVYADPAAMTEQEWEDVFAVDLKSAWLVAVLPAMKAAKKGAIVYVASLHADMAYPGMFPYAGCEVRARRAHPLARARSRPLADARQRAFSRLCRDGAGRRILRPQRSSVARKVLAAHPLRRLGSPSEIANCAFFLLSDEASFVTGANWRVGGGLGARFAD
jgi:NAD(P)-dependent dehydrogenase (short-subunit alcohol dehydrogenase family)